MIARILRRMIRGLVVNPAVGLTVLALFLVGLVTMGAYAIKPDLPKPEIPGIRLPGAGDGATSASRNAPQATENYLKGNQSFNAELMWSSMTSEAQERFRARGSALPELQRQMEFAREQGTKLEGFSYVGGQQLPDGTSMHFYLVLTQGPQSRNDAQYVPYIFTLDRAGKISRVQ